MMLPVCFLYGRAVSRYLTTGYAKKKTEHTNSCPTHLKLFKLSKEQNDHVQYFLDFTNQQKNQARRRLATWFRVEKLCARSSSCP